MADKTQEYQNGLIKKFRDNGDGTWSEVVYIVGGAGGGGGGDASAANQVTGNTTLSAISGKLPATLGAKASAASLPVVLALDQGTVPVGAASLPLPAGASTETTLAALSAKLPSSLGAKTSALSLSVGPATDALFPVNTLAQPGVARQLAAAASNGTSANTVLTATTRRISIRAVGSAIRYAIGAAAQTASATTHYIAADERLDLAVPASAQIAVLSATTTAAVLEVSELT